MNDFSVFKRSVKIIRKKWVRNVVIVNDLSSSSSSLPASRFYVTSRNETEIENIFLLRTKNDEIYNVGWNLNEMNEMFFFVASNLFSLPFLLGWWPLVEIQRERESWNSISSQLFLQTFSTGKLMDQFIFHFTRRFNLTDEFYCLSHRRQITMKHFFFFFKLFDLLDFNPYIIAFVDIHNFSFSALPCLAFNELLNQLPENLGNQYSKNPWNTTLARHTKRCQSQPHTWHKSSSSVQRDVLFIN